MPCPKCAEQPGYHSFRLLGHAKDVAIFYTNPESSKDRNEEGTKLEHVMIHIAEGTAGKPWIWVVDCGTMTIADYTELSFNYGIYNMVTSDPLLQEIWIMRPNGWIQTAIGFFQTISRHAIMGRISYLEGSDLEKYGFLHGKGVDAKTTSWMIHPVG